MPFLVGLAVLVPFVIGAGMGVDHDPAGTPVLRFEDPAIVESSGLVVRPDGLFLTVNDSGDAGRVFAVDAGGRTVGVTRWGDAVDVEAVAADGPGRALVGDIGDNGGVRDSVRLIRVPVGRGDRDVAGTRYDVVYPDGPQNAETLLVHPRTGQVVIITKGVFGGRVMLAPRTLRTDTVNRFTEVGSAIGIATDGAFFADGRHLVVRDYSRAVVYTWPALEEVGGFDLPDQPQGEGIAVDAADRVYVSSEGARSEVLRVDLPTRIQRLLTPPVPPVTSTRPAPQSTPPTTGGASIGAAGESLEPPPSDRRPGWPWAVGGVVGLAAVAVLARSMRPR